MQKADMLMTAKNHRRICLGPVGGVMSATPWNCLLKQFGSVCHHYPCSSPGPTALPTGRSTRGWLEQPRELAMAVLLVKLGTTLLKIRRQHHPSYWINASFEVTCRSGPYLVGNKNSPGAPLSFYPRSDPHPKGLFWRVTRCGFLPAAATHASARTTCLPTCIPAIRSAQDP